jgi:small-conductance mechanosensitive channel
MGKWLQSYFNTDNLIFLGILIAGVAIIYVCTIALKSMRMILVEKKRDLVWLLDGCFGPLMFFILATAYGCAYSFLRLPMLSLDALERTLGILLFIDAGWAILNVGKGTLIALFKVVSQSVMRIYTIVCLIVISAVIIALYYQFYSALILGAIIAILFVLLVNEITRIAPEIRPRQEETLPRRLIMTHIYIATSETDEAVKRALQAIKEAIEATDGTEKSPYASLAGFTHGAFDILIRYYISVPEKLDEVKQEVNLAIIRKLRDINIKLSEH